MSTNIISQPGERDVFMNLAHRVAAADAVGNREEAHRLSRELFEALIEAFIERDGPEVFQEELPGILAWAVEGCLLWQQEGLEPPEQGRGR